uniref:Dynein axonemal intermediate chain 7 n=1 Tax=Anas platyrhynchos platyrhynchos TaxID=8840 RepID=U3J8P4_ANAPP
EEAARLEKERIERELMEKLEAKVSLYATWEHYIACDGSPDPTIPQEINTFMNLCREDQNKDIQLVVEKGQQVLNLIEKLQFFLLDTPPSEITEKEIVQYQETILELQNLLHQKYNEATEHLLKTASMYEDSDTGNMQAVIKDKNVTFCIWANLKKKVRYNILKFLIEVKPAFILQTHNPESKESTHHSKDNVEELEEEKKAAEEPNVPTEEEAHSDERKVGKKSHKRIFYVLSPQIQEENNEKEDEITDENIVDLQQFVPVGGVYHIDALQLPPQVKQVKNWNMVELLDSGLEAYRYPPEESDDTPYPPIQITLQLSDNVIYCEEPVIARWDPAGQQWRTDGISNITYETQKSITFEMGAFHTIALLQNVHLNMPYQAWELRPIGINEALLTVTTVFAEVQIQIKVLFFLKTLKDVLSHLTGRWMCPITLRKVLKEAGVNIFPGEYSYKYVSVNKKAPLTEVRAYQQMALVASAFAFGWSKWNLEAGQDQVVFKVGEHLKDDFVKDWSLYMFNGQRALKLKITETSEAFSKELEEDSEFHSTLYHMLKDFASKEAIDRVSTANFLFIDVVFQLLLATRVLTYS